MEHMVIKVQSTKYKVQYNIPTVTSYYKIIIIIIILYTCSRNLKWLSIEVLEQA